MDHNYEKWLQDLYLFIKPYFLIVILAIFLLVIGFRLIRVVMRRLRKYLGRKSYGKTLEIFIINLTDISLKAILIILILNVLGLRMTSLVAVLGSLFFSIGLALSGTLQNFAGGIILIVLKPFKVGDFIEMQGYMGTIDSIQLFHTIMITPDNKRVILPNSPVSNGSLVNYSVNSTRRVDLKFCISYGEDFDQARDVIFDIIKTNKMILITPKPDIKLFALSDSSVDISVKIWVNTPDYWEVYFFMNEKIYSEFPKKGLSIPFPQMELHVKGSKMSRV